VDRGLILEKRMDSLAKLPVLTGTLPFDSRAESIWATGSASDGSGKVRGSGRLWATGSASDGSGKVRGSGRRCGDAGGGCCGGAAWARRSSAFPPLRGPKLHDF
jgi:hypothetical protein